MYRLYKTLDFFRYDLPNFIKNLWKFRRALLYTRSYDYSGILMFLETCTNNMANDIEKHGFEILISRAKKVKKIRRANVILNNIIYDNYIEMAESELGKVRDYQWNKQFSEEEALHIRNVISLAENKEYEEWVELMEIFKGQDCSKFNSNIDFYDQFDGSGIKNWGD